MKILVVSGIFPPDIGGPASYVPRISRSLVEAGHQVDVVTLADKGAEAVSPSFPFAVHRVERHLLKIARVPKVVSLIRRLAAETDVIFANGLVLEAVMAAKLTRTPIVVKVVGDTIWERARNGGLECSIDDFQHASLPFKWRALRSLQSTYMRMVDRIITPSEYLKSIVTGWGTDASLIDVIYNAVPAAPASENLTVPNVDIVSVGRLVPWKGFDQLLSCSAEQGWTLRIVGDGPLRSELQGLAQALGAAAEFAGHVPQSEVPGLMRKAKCFVLNSSYEGLPHIVLEAMAIGVPVVATAAGGTPETVIDQVTGLLVPVGDQDALTHSISSVLNDAGLRKRLIAGASRRLRETFSFERMVADTETTLRSVASARAGREL